MQALITESYSEDEALRFSRYTISQEDEETITQVGKVILKNISVIPLACAPMSALWGKNIRDHTHIPTHLVAGNLSINGRKIFYNNDPSEKLKQVFETSNYFWNGHVWVSFAGTIGDISIFRTAYSEPEDHWLHQLIVNQVGRGREFILGSPSNMSYEPKYILTDDQITALINGFKSMILS